MKYNYQKFPQNLVWKRYPFLLLFLGRQIEKSEKKTCENMTLYCVLNKQNVHNYVVFDILDTLQSAKWSLKIIGSWSIYLFQKNLILAKNKTDGKLNKNLIYLHHLYTLCRRKFLGLLIPDLLTCITILTKNSKRNFHKIQINLNSLNLRS